jgi:hypothetical protein
MNRKFFLKSLIIGSLVGATSSLDVTELNRRAVSSTIKSEMRKIGENPFLLVEEWKKDLTSFLNSLKENSTIVKWEISEPVVEKDATKGTVAFTVDDVTTHFDYCISSRSV